MGCHKKADTLRHCPGRSRSAPIPIATGLTDAFEKLAQTLVTDADSDADGLSDGYEALKSRTDPLAKARTAPRRLADTDRDGISDDAAEVFGPS